MDQLSVEDDDVDATGKGTWTITVALAVRDLGDLERLLEGRQPSRVRAVTIAAGEAA